MGDSLQKKVEDLIQNDYKKDTRKRNTMRGVIVSLSLLLVLVILGGFAIYSDSSSQLEKYAKKMYTIDFEIQEDEDLDLYILDGFMDTYLDSLERCNEKSGIGYKHLFNLVYDTRSEMIKQSKGLRKVPMQSVLQYLDKNLQEQSDSNKLSKQEVTEICQLYFTKHIWNVNEWKRND
jgi:hypothetical protein